MSGIPVGFGVQVILLQSLAYIIDICLINANSAISGTVILRSLIGELFPLLAIRLYQRLHGSQFQHPELVRTDEALMTGILGIDFAWILFTGACSVFGGFLLLRYPYQIIRQVR